SLDNAANDFGSFSATATERPGGSVRVTDSNDLTLRGINVNNGDVAVRTGGDLGLAGDIFAGTGSVALDSLADIDLMGDVAIFAADSTLDATFGALNFDLFGSAETEYDQLSFSGTARIIGTFDFLLGNLFAPTVGDEFNLIEALSLDLTAVTFTLPTLAHGLFFESSLIRVDERDVFRLSVNGSPVPVPEPGALGMTLLGLLLLGVGRRLRCGHRDRLVAR
ncbi:MAG: PEP-CTERM sorting domain-containing protein, partial [Pseudomonadota bacterium]